MNVLHIAATLHGGAGIGLWRYHRALKDAGVDSRILCLNAGEHPPAEVSAIPCLPRALPYRLARRVWPDIAPARRLLRRVAHLDAAHGSPCYELFSVPHGDHAPELHPWIAEADIVNLHWVAGALDWPRFFGAVSKPVALTLHDQQPYLGGFHYALDRDDHPHLAELETAVRAVKQTAIRSHRLAVVANSAWNAAEARASGFFGAQVPIETVYYPLDVTTYRPRDKASAKAALGIASESVVVGFASDSLGNRRKGFADLLAALDRLPAPARENLVLLSFGRPPTDELRRRVAIPWTHLGFLETDVTKAAAYSAMDVFVIPSRAEAFGQTAIEALACGACVLGADTGGIRETLPSPSHAQCLFPAGDSESLARRLVALIGDPVLRQELAAHGRDHVRQQHDADAIARKLTALYARLLASK